MQPTPIYKVFLAQFLTITFINKIILLLPMAGINYYDKDNSYNLGINVGFFAAFLLFASAF